MNRLNSLRHLCKIHHLRYLENKEKIAYMTATRITQNPHLRKDGSIRAATLSAENTTPPETDILEIKLLRQG